MQNSMEMSAAPDFRPAHWPRNAPPEQGLPRSESGVTVQIYRPARSVKQAGRANSRCWVMEFDSAAPQRIEPLMGWTSCGDPRRHLRLTFPGAEQALAFARRRGWDCILRQPAERRMRPHRYADNFRRPRA